MRNNILSENDDKRNVGLRFFVPWFWNINARGVLFTNILIGIIGLLYLSNLRNSHNWGGDFAMYIMNAQNLVTGTPYAQTGYVYNPDTAYWGNPAYPPIFPLMLAPFVGIWGVNLVMLKIPVIISAIAALLLINTKVLPREMPFLLRILFIICLGLYPSYFFSTEEILSDLPFLLLSYLALFRVDRQIHPMNHKQSNWGTWVVNGILIYLAYGTRSVGIILIPVVFFLSLSRLKRLALSAIVTITTALAFMFTQNILIPEASGGYFGLLPNSIQEIIVTLTFAIKYYAIYFFALFPFREIWVQVFIFIFLASGFIFGAITRLRKGIGSFDIFFVFLIGILLVFPGYQGTRYLLPVLPILFWYTLEGIHHILVLFRYRSLQWVVPVTIFAGLLLYYGNIYSASFPRPQEPIVSPQTAEFFQFIRSSTDTNDVIVFFKPRVLALFTQRNSVVMPIPDPDEDTFERMREFNVSTVVYKRIQGDEYQPGMNAFIQENADKFHLIFENDEFQVFEVLY